MRTTQHPRHLRDRSDDRRAAVDGLAKPPVLRRSTVRAVCAACLALIVYGTLGPLGARHGQWLAPPGDWQWIPPSAPTDYNDVFTNLLVYVPVGIALRLLVRRRGGAGAADLLLAIGLSAALSYLTELLQQLMPARSSNRADLVVNSIAALFGCLIAPAVQNALRRCHEWAFWHWRTHPWVVLSWLMIGLTTVLMTVPWDVTWPTIEVRQALDLDLLDLRRLGVFALVGFFIAAAVSNATHQASRVVGQVFRRVFMLAVVLEASQMFIASHACGLLDVGLAVAGGLAGCVVARWLARSGLLTRDVLTAAGRSAAALAILGAVAFALVSGIMDGGASALGSSEPRTMSLPFQGYYVQPFDHAVTDAIETCVLYSFLTALSLYLTRGRGRRLALVLVAGLAVALQVARVCFLQRPGDITPLLVAIVAWLITVRCWNAFVPERCGAENRASQPAPLAVQ
jgi:hypothetical protein